jgi:cAMP-dependent protein kinase regulator
MREYTALPLFAGCSDSDLRQVSGAATRLSAEAGTVLVRQGDRGRQFVIVLGGTAEVWRDGQPIDEIGAGGYFGEIALIRRIREPASIVARTAMTVDVIEQRDIIAKREFATLYADLSLLRQRLDHALDRRLEKWTAASDAPSPDGATALVLLQSLPPAAVSAPTDNHQPALVPASLRRLRCAAARRMAVTRYRRASR